MLPPDLAPWIEQSCDIHRRIPVMAPYLEFYGYDTLFAARNGKQCDLEKLDVTGIRTFGIALANGSRGYLQVGPDDAEVLGPAEWVLESVRRRFEAALAEAQRCPRVRLIRTARELASDPLGGPIGVIPLITGHSYLTSVKVLDEFFARGLRISHAAISTCATWCGSFPGWKVHGERPPVFSDFGRQIIARMNELGIVIDLAHMLDDSAEAVIKASKKPVIDGHTGSRTAIPGCRGHNDAVLRMIADSGGVAGIHFADHMFTAKVWGAKYPLPGDPRGEQTALWAYNRHVVETVSDPDERARLRRDREAQEVFSCAHNLPPDPLPPAGRIATIVDMADHIDYLVNIMGIEHVGLGGDVNGIGMDQWPLGMDHTGEVPHLTAELLRRGWREEKLEKLLSRNWRRVFAECLPA